MIWFKNYEVFDDEENRNCGKDTGLHLKSKIMASIEQGIQMPGNRKRHTDFSSIRIDMTPMVDLGFLLISFLFSQQEFHSLFLLDLLCLKKLWNRE